MLVLEIAFVLVNLAVPYWLWTSKSETKLPAVERDAMNRAVFRVVAASGGFPPCDAQEVTNRIVDLCDQSRSKWTEKQTTRFERAGADVVFSCEVLKNEVRVRWAHDATSDGHDLECGSRTDAQVGFAPMFAFNLKGQLRTITYARDGQSDATVALTACRRKLAVMKNGRLPASFTKEDTVCLLFDPAEGWNPLRQKYD